MSRLAALLFVLTAPAAMGVLATVALQVEGLDVGVGLGAAALAGALVAAALSRVLAAAMRPACRA